MKLVFLTPALSPSLWVEAKGRVIRLGRDPKATVPLPDPSVSPHHASLKKRGPNWLIIDEESTNGTQLLLNAGDEGVSLSPGVPKVVEEGQIVQMGRVQLRLIERGDVVDPAGESKEIAKDLVGHGLTFAGAHVTEKLVNSALEEIWQVDDEHLFREPEQLAEAGELHSAEEQVPGGSSRRFSTWGPRIDALIWAFAILLAAISGWGLWHLIQ